MKGETIGLVDFKDLEKGLKASALSEFTESAKQFLSEHALENHYKAIAEVVVRGVEEYGRGIVMCNVTEKEHSDEFLAAYRYIPMSRFIEAESNGGVFYEDVANWLIEYNPNAEILFGFWRDFSNTVINIDGCMVCNIPEMLACCRYPLHDLAQVNDFQDIFNESVAASTAKKKPVRQQEKKLELDLYDWLRLHGVAVERQVKTSTKHRLDLWIPGRIMLELKAGRVNADDLCQSIDYQATYNMPILLVGSGMTTGASRGMTGFNTATGDENLRFVTWSAVKTYLKGLLDL